MSLCIAAGTSVLMLSMQVFTLAWTHSVEQTEWREVWRVTPSGLALTEARVKGSGAGVDPPADAVWRDGWFVWQPDLQPIAQLRLALSGFTGEGWRLCDGAACTTLETLIPAASSEAVLSACDRPADAALVTPAARTPAGSAPASIAPAGSAGADVPVQAGRNPSIDK